MLFDAPPAPLPPSLPSHIAAVLRNYAPSAQALAQKLIPTYGMPEEATASQLVWFGPRPFARTVISSEATPHNFPVPHEDIIEQSVKYPLGNAIGRYDDLGAFHGSVTVKRTEGLLSARSESPEMNMLALNLAHDIITGRRGWQAARQYFAQAAAQLNAGQVPIYTNRLVFNPAEGADPDVSIPH